MKEIIFNDCSFDELTNLLNDGNNFRYKIETDDYNNSINEQNILPDANDKEDKITKHILFKTICKKKNIILNKIDPENNVFYVVEVVFPERYKEHKYDLESLG